MNLNLSREIRAQLPALIAGFLLLGFILAVTAWTSRQPPDLANAGQNADRTRTAVALTSQALLGPFPSSTAPTPTTTVTARPSITPTFTPTRAPTNTPTPFLLFTWTPRTNVPRATFTSTAPPTNTPRPTNPPPTTYP